MPGQQRTNNLMIQSEILTTKQERRSSGCLGFNIRPQLSFGVVAFNKESWNDMILKVPSNPF